MKEIKIGFSDVLGAVEEVLRYFSGKRAEDETEYFRYVACDADRKLLIQLIEECSARIDLDLGRYGGGYTVKQDEIIFNIGRAGDMEMKDDVSRDLDPNRERTIYTLLRLLIINMVVRRWLFLAGYKSTTALETECRSLLEQLLTHIRTSLRTSRIRGPRYVPPV